MASSSQPASPTVGSNRNRRSGRGTSLSSFASAVASPIEGILEKDLPPGFLAATAEATNSVPTLGEFRGSGLGDRRGDSRRSKGHSQPSNRLSLGWDSNELPGTDHSRTFRTDTFPVLREVPTNTSSRLHAQQQNESSREEWISAEGPWSNQKDAGLPSHDESVDNFDYTRSPKLPWTTSTGIALKAFWRWFWTPFGFLLTIYGLNIVAWGGMLFLLLCNASPAMCWTSSGTGSKSFDCNAIDSPRRIWIEVDSQILNALFCVTGFGLAPWRFRDLYYILSFRLTNEQKHGKTKKLFGLRKLAGHYRSWYRLPGSHTLEQKLDNSALDAALESDLRIPLPVTKQANDPLTGNRATPTALWKVDFFIWTQVWNTFFQACLAGFMWGMNRYNRPSWSTGLFVALACIVAGAGGVMSYIEGRKVKRVEGVMPSQAVQEALRKTGNLSSDLELGLQKTRTGHESVHVEEPKKMKLADHDRI